MRNVTVPSERAATASTASYAAVASRTVEGGCWARLPSHCLHEEDAVRRLCGIYSHNSDNFGRRASYVTPRGGPHALTVIGFTGALHPAARPGAPPCSMAASASAPRSRGRADIARGRHRSGGRCTFGAPGTNRLGSGGRPRRSCTERTRESSRDRGEIVARSWRDRGEIVARSWRGRGGSEHLRHSSGSPIWSGVGALRPLCAWRMLRHRTMHGACMAHAWRMHGACKVHAVGRGVVRGAPWGRGGVLAN